MLDKPFLRPLPGISYERLVSGQNHSESNDGGSSTGGAGIDSVPSDTHKDRGLFRATETEETDARLTRTDHGVNNTSSCASVCLWVSVNYGEGQGGHQRH